MVGGDVISRADDVISRVDDVVMFGDMCCMGGGSILTLLSSLFSTTRPPSWSGPTISEVGVVEMSGGEGM